MPAIQFREVLRILRNHEVDFLVVGGVAALLHGAPVNTFDLDVVHSREPENVTRLLMALRELDARYRIQPERNLRPEASHLSSPGHQLLSTTFGPVDFLGSIGARESYADLLPDSAEVALAPDLSVRVLNLETLIRVKEQAGRDKDRAVLPTLRATLDQRRR